MLCTPSVAICVVPTAPTPMSVGAISKSWMSALVMVPSTIVAEVTALRMSPAAATVCSWVLLVATFRFDCQGAVGVSAAVRWEPGA